MMYIKLKDDMSLVITVRKPLFRGDNLNRKVIYLIPKQIGTIDVESSCVMLSYIRADGVADVDILEQMEEMYNDDYYQYTLPITSKLTKYPGDVCTWIQFYSGDPEMPKVSKTGECDLQIQESKDLDDYLSDSQVAAIYRMNQRIKELATTGGLGLDGLSYNKDTRVLGLSADGEIFGQTVIVPADEYDDNLGDGDTTWEDMDGGNTEGENDTNTENSSGSENNPDAGDSGSTDTGSDSGADSGGDGDIYWEEM